MSSLLFTSLPLCASLMKPLIDVTIKLLVIDSNGSKLGHVCIRDTPIGVTIDQNNTDASLWKVIQSAKGCKILKNKKNGLFIALSMDGQSLTVTASESDSLKFVYDNQSKVYCFSFNDQKFYPNINHVDSNRLFVVKDVHTDVKLLPIFVSS